MSDGVIAFRADGRDVEVPDDGASLLEVLRDRLGLRSPKDGCSPQGQCGCCTVLVDGQPRVACVTPARRVAGREVTTLDGLPGDVRDRWVSAFSSTGASQCGFCTPGILVRLAALAPPDLTPDRVENALLAHLCRCTGWRTILDAAELAKAFGRDEASMLASSRPKAEQRATIEGGTAQRVGADVVLGHGGFADDTAPADALVAVLGADGEWHVAETLVEARRIAGKVQGRRTTIDVGHPLDVPPGDWERTLRTTWVEPAYLEPDASWCVPGGEPATPLANGGAFGGKLHSIAPRAARELADKHGRAVRVLLAREDVVRLGPKRPPIAAGVRAGGTGGTGGTGGDVVGVVRVVRTAGIADAIRSVAPGLLVEEVDVAGPPTSAAIRAAGWAEAAVLCDVDTVTAPNGARASARVAADGSIDVEVACGDVLDEVVLRSYCIGAAHQALGWVTSEAIAVDGDGVPHDLTIRSFGVLRAKDTPEVRVTVDAADAREPVNGSDAVFAAVAGAVWRHLGHPQDWPVRRIEKGSA